MKYQWDNFKCSKNLESHHIHFSSVFDFDWDSVIYTLDDRYVYGEDRWVAMGRIKKTGCIFSFIRNEVTQLESSVFGEQTKGRLKTMKKPTEEGIDSVESPALTSEMIAKMCPVREDFPDMPRFIKVRGKQKTPIKKQINIRLNLEVIEYFKSGGRGWQTRINDILTEYVSANT